MKAKLALRLPAPVDHLSPTVFEIPAAEAAAHLNYKHKLKAAGKLSYHDSFSLWKFDNCYQISCFHLVGTYPCSIDQPCSVSTGPFSLADVNRRPMLSVSARIHWASYPLLP